MTRWFEDIVIDELFDLGSHHFTQDKIIRFARDLLHFDHFAIRILDERTGKLELVIGYGIGSEYDAFVIRPGLEGHGITGYVAASGRSYVCEDTSTDPLYLPGVVDAKSSLTVPLRIHEYESLTFRTLALGFRRTTSLFHVAVRTTPGRR